MTLTGLKKGIYDELYVTDGSTLTRIDGTNSLEADVTQLQAQDVNLQTQITSNDASMSSNFASLGADVVALETSKQDVMSATAPIQIQNNTIGIDLINLGDITAGNVTCSGIFGGAQAQLSGVFATKAENALKEPSFLTTSDLQKILNVQDPYNPTIQLGISSTFETRVATAEANISIKEPAFVSTSDLQKTLNVQNTTIELGISSTLEARIVNI